MGNVGSIFNRPQPSDPTFVLRSANHGDLDSLTTIAQQGFPDDPEWNYRFPTRSQYPEDNRKWTRLEYEEYLQQPEKYAVLVVDANFNNEGKNVSKAIALGVWDISVLNKSRCGDAGIHERRDANPTHMEVFKRALEQGFIDHFEKYGENQIHLWLLATLPEFRRHGAGTMLCNWGKEKASERNCAITVFGSPMGTALYKKLGYRLLDSVSIHVDGEDEKFNVFCLVLDQS